MGREAKFVCYVENAENYKIAWVNVDDHNILTMDEIMVSRNHRYSVSKAETGKKHFAAYCAACHGQDGTGNPALGAPNLTNGIWLYGGTREQIIHTLRVGRNGQMPAFKDSLSEDKIHILTAYVYGLSREQ